MKKLNLTFKITLLFITFLTCSFIAKTDIHLTTNYEKSTITTPKETQVMYTNKVLIIYSTGTTKQQKNQARLCFSSNLGGQVINVTQCPNNSNTEVVTYSNLKIALETTTGLEDGGEEDDNIGGNEDSNGFIIVTTDDIHEAIGRCQNILGHSTNTLDCSGPLDPFNIGF